MKPGNVPTERVGPVLSEMIRDRWPFGGGIEILADKVGCDWTAIEGVIKGVHEGVSFDLADKLLCAVGRSDIWAGELSDVYPMKFVETCGLHSCSKTFPEKKAKGHVKHYCSDRCRNLANGVKRGDTPGDRMRQRGRFYCGHQQTPENTTLVGEGKRTCLTCRREKTRAATARYRARKKESMTRDIRDPQIVGQSLLDLCEKQKGIQPSVLADLNGLPAADWTGDGLMSNDPALHHSRTSQAGNEKIEGS